MKKIFASVLALAMIFGAFASTLAEGASGVWYGDTRSIANAGTDIILVLNENGTAAITLGEQNRSGSWIEHDGLVGITFDSETVEFTLTEEDMLRGSVDGMDIAFIREDAQITLMEGAVPADYEGSWTIAYAFDSSNIYTADMLIKSGMKEENLVITIDFGNLIAGGSVIQLEFMDGYYASLIDDSIIFTLALLEDGTLDVADMLVGLQYVCVKNA